MNETVELTRFDVPHNHKLTHKVMEELAIKEWIESSRKSKIPGATYYPAEIPQVITADKIVNELENMNHRLISIEKLMKKIMDRISKFESKQEELEFKILSYEASE